MYQSLGLGSDERSDELVAEYDLAVGAVPGPMGFDTVRRVLESGVDLVDISFFEQEAAEVYRQLTPAAIATAEQDPGSDRKESLTAGRSTPRDDPTNR